MDILTCLANFCTKRQPSDEEPLINTSEKTLTALPHEVLQKIIEPLGIKDRYHARLCCRGLAEAVSTVKWPRHEVEIAIRILPIPSARTLSLPQSPTSMERQDLGPQKDQEYEVHVNLSDLELSADWSEKFRLCKTISTRYLTIFGGPIDKTSLRYVNELLDVCTFDNLSLKLAPGQRLTERAYDLISRAKNSVCLYAYDNDISVEEYLKLSSPTILCSTIASAQLYMISDLRCVSRSDEMRRPITASRPPSCHCVHTIGDPDPSQLSQFANCRHWQRWRRSSQE